MKLQLYRSFNSKIQFTEYLSFENSDEKYTCYARDIESIFRPLYFVKYGDKEICRLEEENSIRPWFEWLSIIIPYFNAKYTFRMKGLKEKSYLSHNGKYYAISINNDLYAIKGHSHCIVTIWKNNIQVGIIKRINLSIVSDEQTIEVLYENNIPKELILLFSAFGWEVFVGERTITNIVFNNQPFDISWRPNE